MITSYVSDGGRLAAQQGLGASEARIVWIDLQNPDRDEESQVEERFRLDVPTREEMEEIEISSRLYTEDGALFMTAILPSHADGDDPDMLPVSFVLAKDTLITLRYHDPRVFATFPALAAGGRSTGSRARSSANRAARP